MATLAAASNPIRTFPTPSHSPGQGISRPVRCATKTQLPMAVEALAQAEDQLNNANLGQTTVLLVDDAAVIRRTVIQFLNTEPAIKVLGEAVNFEEAISLATTLKPDVILLDLHMPDDSASCDRIILKLLQSNLSWLEFI